MTWIEFELIIMDWAEDEKLEDTRELELFADDLHQHIEIALSDYADDNDIEDYEPSY